MHAFNGSAQQAAQFVALRIQARIRRRTDVFGSKRIRRSCGSLPRTQPGCWRPTRRISHPHGAARLTGRADRAGRPRAYCRRAGRAARCRSPGTGAPNQRNAVAALPRLSCAAGRRTSCCRCRARRLRARRLRAAGTTACLPEYFWPVQLAVATAMGDRGLRFRAGRTEPRSPSFGPGAHLLLGFAYAGLRAQQRLADELAVAQTKVATSRDGHRRIACRCGSSGAQRFEFDVESHDADDAVPRSPAARLVWGRESFDPPNGGRLIVRLRRPHGAMNPVGVDFEAWLLERDLRAPVRCV